MRSPAVSTYLFRASNEARAHANVTTCQEALRKEPSCKRRPFTSRKCSSLAVDAQRANRTAGWRLVARRSPHKCVSRWAARAMKRSGTQRAGFRSTRPQFLADASHSVGTQEVSIFLVTASRLKFLARSPRLRKKTGSGAFFRSGKTNDQGSCNVGA